MNSKNGSRGSGPHPAVVPEVRGESYVTGFSELVLERRDPLWSGFVLR